MARFHDWPVRRKLLAFVVGAAALPLLAAVVTEFHTAHDLLEHDAAALLDARAHAVAARIDEFHATQQRRAAEAARRLAAGDPGRDVRAIMDDLRARDPIIQDLLVDEDGDIPGVPRRDLDDARGGKPTISSVFIDPGARAGLPLIAYLSPVPGAPGRVVALRVRASGVWDLMARAHGLAGPGSFAILIDDHGIRIGHSHRQDLLFRPIGRLGPAVVEELVGERRFGEGTRDVLERNLPLEGQLDLLALEEAAAPVRIWSPANSEWNLCALHQLDLVGWRLLYLVPERLVLGSLQRLVVSTVLVAAVFVLLSLVAGHALSSRLVRPLEALSAAAKRFGRGDLGARVEVRGADEVGTLGRRFNEMAEALAETHHSLERKVAERTADLEHAKRALEGQNRALEERSVTVARGRALALAYGNALAALETQGSLEAGVAAALRALAGAVGGVVAACYRHLPDGSHTVVASYGAAGPTPLPVAGGLLCEALKQRRPISIDGVPDGLELRFELGMIGGRPTHCFVSPLLFREQEVGALVIGTLAPLPDDAEALVGDVGVAIALNVLRQEAGEQRDRFAGELGQKNMELEAQAEELRAQGEALVAQQRELEARAREVEAANRHKSEFIANMSHELRTPLNTVIGFTDLLLEGGKDGLGPAATRQIEAIGASGRHLLDLINDILDLSKIDAGRMTLAVEPVRPGSAIADARTALSAAAQRKQMRFSERIETERPVAADRRRLRQILINLTANAVKFAPAGSTIEIGAADEGGRVRFWVRDEGPGLPPRVRERLFEPFVQGENPLVKHHEGTGLGLAICRRLVVQHGGEIGFEGGDGAGTTFWFALAAHGLPAPADAPGEQPAIAVLAIDDDPGTLALLRAALAPPRYQLTVASTGRDGLAQARVARFDVVLLDLGLPDVPGTEVLDQLGAECPVIVLTGSALGPDQQAELRRRAALIAEKGDFTCAALENAIAQVVRPRAPRPSNGAPILVVDDHDLNRELVRMLLEARGHRVVVAADGIEAVARARAERPALVLMDLAMPKQDGYSATRELRADPATRDIPVIALTALAMREDEARARQAGFDDFLTKPIDGDKLGDIVDRFLARST